MTYLKPLNKIIKYAVICLVTVSAQAAVIDHNTSITSNETWYASDTHYLGDYVFVENNVTLTI